MPWMRKTMRQVGSRPPRTLLREGTMKTPNPQQEMRQREFAYADVFRHPPLPGPAFRGGHIKPDIPPEVARNPLLPPFHPLSMKGKHTMNTIQAAPAPNAVILFNGKDVSNWTTRDGNSAGWKVEDGILHVVPGIGGNAPTNY